MTKEMERLKEIEARKEELRGKLDADGITSEEITAIQEEARKLSDEEKEIRTKIDLRGALEPKPISQGAGEEGTTMTDEEKRAQAFADTGKLAFRALLASGKIATPTAVSGINGLADVESSIVDDVKSIPLTGNGAYTVAYKVTEASAADVTDGEAIGGTGATFDYVTINPAEWGIIDEISQQVKKLSPLQYANEIKSSALVALRAMAASKIIAAVKASALVGKKTVALDQDFLRTVALGHKSITGKGACKLYLNQEDLMTLGKVRGTNEKKALYEIKFDEGSNTNGTITEGGLSVRFSLSEDVAKGTQLYGQPLTIEMPLWDDYMIETDGGGEYFKRNMIGIRGIQTANADLCAKEGMELISQS